MEPIIELLDTCQIVMSKTETSYRPLGSPPDAYVFEQLDICQRGISRFHHALQRPGNPKMKGEA